MIKILIFFSDKSVPANKLCGIQELMDEKLKEMTFGKKKETKMS